MSRPRGFRFRDVWTLIRSRITGWRDLVRWIVWAYAKTASLDKKHSTKEARHIWRRVSILLYEGGAATDRACDEVVIQLKAGDCEAPWRR
jgi:hypothetical protein